MVYSHTEILSLSISPSIHSSGRQGVTWFCRGCRTWQNTCPHSSPVSHSLWSLHQQSGATLTNVPSSQSCQHTNKPWFNDPWHHICLCGWLFYVAVWQTQLLKMDPSVTWKESYSLCITLLSTVCVWVCFRDKERVILFILSDQINKLNLKWRWLWGMFAIVLAKTPKHGAYIIYWPIKAY